MTSNMTDTDICPLCDNQTQLPYFIRRYDGKLIREKGWFYCNTCKIPFEIKNSKVLQDRLEKEKLYGRGIKS